MKLKNSWVCMIWGVVFAVTQAAGQTNTFPDNGNVGIGTTSPSTKLDVEGGGGITVGGLPALSGTPVIRGTSTGGRWLSLHPDLSGGSWNGIVQPGDQGLIYSGGGLGTGSFVLAPWANGPSGIRMDSSGNVGIGVSSPGQKLSIANGSLSLDGLAFLSSMRNGINNYTNAFLGGNVVDNGNGTYSVGTDGGSNFFAAVRMDDQGDNAGAINFYTGASTGGTSYSMSNNQLFAYQRMTIVGSNVGIGTGSPGARLEVNGGIKLTSGTGSSLTFADNTVQSTAWTGVLSGGDYAESVDVTGKRTAFEPGDLLVIDPKTHGHFQKSSTPYCSLIGGVYATKPGVTGRRQPRGKPQEEEVPMAMVGIVPTKVSTENGPIHDGDLLVSSSTPGYAMKGTDRNKLTGAILGKALGAIESGSGVIEVLISLQ